MILGVYRRRRIIVGVLCCMFVALVIISHLFFERGYWNKAPLTSPISESTTKPQILHPPDDAAVPPETPPVKTLIVSAMFPLKKSKHPMKSYKSWLNNLFELTTPIYLFIPPSLSELLPRHIPSHLTINNTFDSVFDLPGMKGREPVYEANQWSLDPERDIHGPELYAIWNSKPWLLEEGYRNKGGEWDYIFWVDAGSFRGRSSYRHWPDGERVRDVWAQQGSPANESTPRIFMPTVRAPETRHSQWREENGPIDQDVSMASFFGGTPAAVHWYTSVYTAYHDHWLSQNIFVGKDQNIINALFLLFPSRFFTVYYDDPHANAHRPYSSILDQRLWRAKWKDWHFAGAYAASRALGKCGTECYYYKFFFAAEDERMMMSERWMREHDGWDRWPFGSQDSDVVEVRERCRLTRAMSFDEMLTRADRFGSMWTPPERQVNITF